MTQEELKNLVGEAYGYPLSAVRQAVLALVPEIYDHNATDAAQLTRLYWALWHTRKAVDQALAAVVEEMNRKAATTK